MLARRIEPPRAKAFRLGPARRALTALRAERFDIALDFQGLWKSAVWARLSGARRVVGFAGRHRREPAALEFAQNLIEEETGMPLAAAPGKTAEAAPSPEPSSAEVDASNAKQAMLS